MSKTPSKLDEIRKWIEERKGPRDLHYFDQQRALAALEKAVVELDKRLAYAWPSEASAIMQSLVAILHGEREETGDGR